MVSWELIERYNLSLEVLGQDSHTFIKGQVLSVAIDDANIVQYCTGQLNNPDLALTIATRCDLGGADDLFVKKFQLLFQQGAYADAAKVAARAPRGVLRTPQVITFPPKLFTILFFRLFNNSNKFKLNLDQLHHYCSILAFF